eukprot:926523-Pelagomonas_calceolata.AAC.3
MCAECILDDIDEEWFIGTELTTWKMKAEKGCYIHSLACLALTRCQKASSFHAGKRAYMQYSVNGGVVFGRLRLCGTRGGCWWVAPIGVDAQKKGLRELAHAASLLP